MAVKLFQQQRERGGRHLSVSGQMIIGLLFVVALIAFEIFNFDTTQYALGNLLGATSFAGVRWATVLAIAFCAIDFAGLLRFFLPEEDEGETPVEVWYLMGAWLLGATMNALMTWWAVSLTLLDHELGNEILSRTQLLEIVPVFVALLVWLTRILFIGAFTVAGGYLFDFDRLRSNPQRSAGRRQPGKPAHRPVPATLKRIPAGKSTRREERRTPLPAALRRLRDEESALLEGEEALIPGGDKQNPATGHEQPTRVQRPPSRPQRLPMHASPRRDA